MKSLASSGGWFPQQFVLKINEAAGEVEIVQPSVWLEDDGSTNNGRIYRANQDILIASWGWYARQTTRRQSLWVEYRLGIKRQSGNAWISVSGSGRTGAYRSEGHCRTL
ncbi:hypothetical protein [Aliiroseovarius sp. YM-037]|uniref:hypothetical protein n=1 Tax=Aliiroseovarius sp. YM-037 TaxID=3341728 RepID=UPI003A809564